MDSRELELPLCPACHQPVRLELAKTDEYGRAIHEKCYVLIALERGPRTEQKPDDSR